ncbi:MAG: family 1 glycosylhydrolase, partial [Rhodospirillales bacterium]|nr:family 1 glycosylhydrolase [Acetobacter sp.]
MTRLDGFSRRRFGKGIATATTALSAGALGSSGASAQTAGAPQQPTPRQDYYSFPQGFLWGCATAAYQVEGATTADGRGVSIWDKFSHTPGKIFGNQNADVADDHYHRFKEDIGLLKSLGAQSYRFSVAWPRIFPQGTGQPNARGMDFYKRLIDTLQAQNIRPFCTLFHWDLPQALQDRFGGWEGRDTAQAFGDYAGYVAGQLSDRVSHFFTVNEYSSFIDLGYRDGKFAPGLRLPPARLNQARHNAVLAHGLAVQAIRAKAQPGTKVGLAENLTSGVPVIETPEHIQASVQATRMLNAPYLTVILEGKYTDGFLQFAGKDAPKFTEQELRIISEPNDFVGLNIYAPQFYIAASDKPPGWSVLPFPTSFPHMNSEWLRIGPETIYWAPRLAAKVWNIETIYISENGTSSEDKVHADGQVYDLDRIMYLRNYLR